MNYFCKLETEAGEDGFTVVFPDLPGRIIEGETIEEALAMAAETLNGCLESDIAGNGK